ncbi:uncharacterized protein METZ01_LOCUS324796 [marine metagenome]|uniref:6-pyruvoyl tetrahydrobiopterin synthase n=1 Tax=marine metagenome TaxID=408172 RepID=A0A382PIY8_9ZZZZ
MNEDTGFVTDFDNIAKSFDSIRQQVDHNYLNDLEGLDNPTSEVLIKWIWDRLNPKLKELDKLVLWENEVSRVEYDEN